MKGYGRSIAFLYKTDLYDGLCGCDYSPIAVQTLLRDPRVTQLGIYGIDGKLLRVVRRMPSSQAGKRVATVLSIVAVGLILSLIIALL